MISKAALPVILTCILADVAATAGTNLEITAFSAGEVTWTNVDTNLYYTVEWLPALGASNDWTGSYRGAQDLTTTDATITVSVPVFYRVTGTRYPSYPPAAPARTGQTTMYFFGDDGGLAKGTASPVPRFRDNNDGTITDALTGLIWLKNANSWTNSLTWVDAMAAALTLNSGEHGLTDGSLSGEWRVPNLREFQSLMDYGQYSPALPAGHLFTNLMLAAYWTSSTAADTTGYAWRLALSNGIIDKGNKGITSYLWPVRDAK